LGEDKAIRARQRKKRVAILGGGCGGLAAAFWLSSTEALRQQYEVTVYTRGWRLGGKGASGRSPDADSRIEEHGLHLWMGCYRHAFSMMKACYAGSSGPYRSLRDAFIPIRQIILEERDGNETPPPWDAWPIPFPPLSGDIGDATRPSLGEIVTRLSKWLEQALDRNPVAAEKLPDYKEAFAAFRLAVSSGDAADRQRAMALMRKVNIQTAPPLTPPAAALTASVHTLGPPQTVRRIFVVANLGTAIFHGVLDDILPHPADDYQVGFDQLNDREFRAWLQKHGAVPEARAAAPVRAVYDLAFGYTDGPPWTLDNASMAAGVTLRLILEIAGGYRDAPFWRMESGMGDTIFAPLHQVLRDRGVAINFFHRVKEIIPSADQTRIATVKMARQAELKNPPYQPFVCINGRDCWPNAPQVEQLKPHPQRAADANFESSWDATEVDEVTLTEGAQGDGFDLVVVALPPEVLKTIAGGLTQPTWVKMLQTSRSVATQAFQVWLNVAPGELGCNLPPDPVTAFDQPFATWADMTHLLDRETWPVAAGVKSIHYFCGPLTMPFTTSEDPDPIREETQRAEGTAAGWLDRKIGALWPLAIIDNVFEPAYLVKKYARANVDLSDRYVQVPAGSVDHRLPPGKSGYANLFLAGDWTRTRNSGGCVEVAVESGLLAARAISGDPTLGST
jgi:uncharacterized protein with NAD-binding domain and iron-sulfur cluster